MALLEDEDGAPYPGGVQAIAEERARQITEEGYSPEHDAQHSVTDLLEAADAYLLSSYGHDRAADFWPWGAESFKPGDQRRALVKAGALIAAAIDRLDAGEKP